MPRDKGVNRIDRKQSVPYASLILLNDAENIRKRPRDPGWDWRPDSGIHGIDVGRGSSALNAATDHVNTMDAGVRPPILTWIAGAYPITPQILQQGIAADLVLPGGGLHGNTLIAPNTLTEFTPHPLSQHLQLKGSERHHCRLCLSVVFIGCVCVVFIFFFLRCCFVVELLWVMGFTEK